MNFVSKLILFLFLFLNVIVIFIFQSELLKVIIYFIFRHMTLSVSSNTIGSCIIRLAIAAIHTNTSQLVSKHICRYENFVKLSRNSLLRASITADNYHKIIEV